MEVAETEEKQSESESDENPTEERKRIVLNRKEKRKAQRAKKQAQQIKVPKTGQIIGFREKNSNEGNVRKYFMPRELSLDT